MTVPSVTQSPVVMDVYLTAREFASWGGKAYKMLPAPLRECIIDVGVCHYMVLVKSQDGRVLQLDFGPRGGRDVHVAMPGSRLARAAMPGPHRVLPTEPLELERASAPQLSEAEPGVPGEVRQRWLQELPSHTPVVHVGTTNMSSDQILEFSKQQPTYYLLHNNDCRHYANNLVRRMTGVDRATAMFLRQQYQEKVSRSPQSHPHRPLVEALQACTDYTNWDAIKQATSMLPPAMASLFGLNLLRGVRGLPVPMAAGLKATRAITKLVRSKAAVAVNNMARTRAAVTATVSRPAAITSIPTVTPLSAAAVAWGQRLPLPWPQQHSTTLLMTAFGASSTLSTSSSGRKEETAASDTLAPARAPARISQAMTAALATYAASCTSTQPVVQQLLGQHVGRLRGALSQAVVSASRAGSATSTTSSLGNSLAATAEPAATTAPIAGAIVARSPITSQARAPAPAHNLTTAHSTPSTSQGSHRAAGYVSQTITSRAGLPKVQRAARFVSRGGTAGGLLLSSMLARQEVRSSRGSSVRTVAGTACALTVALQQQAAKWHLIG